MTGCGVVEHPPYSDHRVSVPDSDLLLKGLSNFTRRKGEKEEDGEVMIWAAKVL